MTLGIIDEIYLPLHVLARERNVSTYVALSLPDGEVVDLRLYAAEAAQEGWDRPWARLQGHDHPRLLRIWRQGRWQDGAYVAHEHLAGLPLPTVVQACRRHAADSGGLAEAEVLAVGRQLAEGLEYLHQAKTLVRGLPPESVFIGNSGQVKIVAIPLALGKEDVGMCSTALGKVPAGPFLAPEQMDGAASVAGDIFTLGSLLYYMLSGQPINKLDPLALQYGGGRAPIVPLRRHVADLSVETEALVMACLEQDAPQRPQSCIEVLERLSAALGEPHTSPSVYGAPSPILADLVHRVRTWSAVAPVVDGTLPLATAPPSQPMREEPLPLSQGRPWVEIDDGRRILLHGDSALIGRRDDRLGVHPEIEFAYGWVHRRHATLSRQHDGWHLAVPQGATNGTWLNQERLEPGSDRRISHGDEITLGDGPRSARLTLYLE